MGNKCVIAVMLSLIFILTGCSSFSHKDVKKSDEVNTVNTTVFNFEKESISIKSRESTPVVYDLQDTIPLTANGSMLGTLNVNLVERLGITDLLNPNAVSAGVDYAYAINMRTNLSKYTGQSISLKCTPSLETSDKKIIGSAANLGWSGFDSKVEYVNDLDQDKYLEVNLQPEVREIPEDGLLKINFESLTGNLILDDIYIKASDLKTAREGAALKREKDVFTVNAFNGANYSIQLKNAHYLWTKKEGNNRSEPFSFFDFTYKLKYLTAPTLSNYVASFDNYDNDAYVSPLVIGMQTDSSPDILYNEDKTAIRLTYVDDSTYYPYVTDWVNRLYVGDSCSIVTNREWVDDRDNYNPSYVRLRVEFPEEASARDPQSLLDFNGRYLVYQLKIKQYKLKEKEEG